jgi:hypothetical protein
LTFFSVIWASFTVILAPKATAILTHHTRLNVSAHCAVFKQVYCACYFSLISQSTLTELRNGNHAEVTLGIKIPFFRIGEYIKDVASEVTSSIQNILGGKASGWRNVWRWVNIGIWRWGFFDIPSDKRTPN